MIANVHGRCRGRAITKSRVGVSKLKILPFEESFRFRHSSDRLAPFGYFYLKSSSSRGEEISLLGAPIGDGYSSFFGFFFSPPAVVVVDVLYSQSSLHRRHGWSRPSLQTPRDLCSFLAFLYLKHLGKLQCSVNAPEL